MSINVSTLTQFSSFEIGKKLFALQQYCSSFRAFRCVNTFASVVLLIIKGK